MLAVPANPPGVPPAGEGWVHEVKWDGVRLLAETVEGGVRLTNRTEGDVTPAYPEIVAAKGSLPDGLLLDGEVIALDASGVPTLQALASRMHVRDPLRTSRLAVTRPVTYMVFDLLRLRGEDVTHLPLWKRRELLDSVDIEGTTTPYLGRAVWQVSEQHEDGETLAAATRAAGLEGVVSKRRDSVYVPGGRTDAWVKVPHRTEFVAVIGGWLPESTSPDRLGALWVGLPADEATFESRPVLYSMGRVGSGLGHAQRDDLLQVLREIERPTCPFEPTPTGPEARRARWVEPMLCAQVRYLTITEGGTLRQPVLRALRPDVAPVDAGTAALFEIS
ncbi:MAG TPA: non-homologous end-joining DNA ligase [Propionibacteriaceae bacterium]|nr:non-homologous end-joining DNA ligase [Propionibacteriaceae bacterium]